LIIFEGIVKAPIEALRMNGIDRQTYIIQAKESDNTQDRGQHKNASIQKTDWLVDDLYKLKLKPKAKRLIWEQKHTDTVSSLTKRKWWFIIKCRNYLV